MNVLVDTSVWVAHFRASSAQLISLVGDDRILCHPLILAEIACGTPPAPRQRTLGDLALLARAQEATQNELLQFIEREKLYGLGCGFVDIALLCSACITPETSLWTLDTSLSKLAKRFDVQFKSAH